MKQSTKYFLFILAVLAALIWSSVAKSPEVKNPDGVSIYFFDVGQGDASLIMKGSYQILIDGGPSDKILSEIGKVLPLTDRKIEKAILTHPHADHLTGINEILKRYEVEEIIESGAASDSAEFKEFNTLVEEKKIKKRTPEIGEKENPFENGKLEYIWPGSRFKDQSPQNLNDSSEVVRFCYFSKCVLFTGDLEVTGQLEMFNYYSSSIDDARNQNTDSSSLASVSENVFKSELLKISHHGSSNGTNQIMMDKAAPNYALISVGGENRYGHPHSTVLDLLQKSGVNLFRTDRDGTVRFLITQDNIIKK